MEGWIKIHRGVFSHWVSKDPVKFKWWLIMLSEVNYVENKTIIGAELYSVPIGGSMYSLRTWATKFECGVKAVVSFFDLLEKDGMIGRKTVGKGKQCTTLINITNYSRYQVSEETPKESTRKRQGHTTKEGNKEKNTDIPDFNEFMQYAILLPIYKPSHNYGLTAKYNSWVDNGWRDGNDKKINNWKTKLQNTLPYIKEVAQQSNSTGLI